MNAETRQPFRKSRIRAIGGAGEIRESWTSLPAGSHGISNTGGVLEQRIRTSAVYVCASILYTFKDLAIVIHATKSHGFSVRSASDSAPIIFIVMHVYFSMSSSRVHTCSSCAPRLKRAYAPFTVFWGNGRFASWCGWCYNNAGRGDQSTTIRARLQSRCVPSDAWSPRGEVFARGEELLLPLASERTPFLFLWEDIPSLAILAVCLWNLLGVIYSLSARVQSSPHRRLIFLNVLIRYN